MRRHSRRCSPNPSRDCPLCPRLHDFIAGLARARAGLVQRAGADLHAAGGRGRGRLLIVGLAPGLRGANRTGRPFTGDYAGDLLYRTLISFGFARGQYQARPDDGLQLVGTRDHQCGALRAAGEQAGRRGDRHLPRLPRRRPSRAFPTSRRAGARRHRPSVGGAGARRPRRAHCRSGTAAQPRCRQR